MKKKDVKVRDMDVGLWNWFVGYCKQKGLTVAEGIEKHIKRLKNI